MNWQQRLGGWIRDNHRRVDLTLAGIFGLVAIVMAIVIPVEGSEREPGPLAYALIIGAAVTLAWRRSHPLATLPIVMVFTSTYWILDYSGGLDHLLLLSIYSTVRFGGGDRRRVWTITAICILLSVSVAVIGVLVPSEDLPPAALFGIVFITATAAAIGEALYQRSLYISELEQRTAALEADLETKAELAAVEERTRIAREMHDIVAHGMSAIVVQAVAGQSVAEHDAAKTQSVLKTIETIGRDSVDEMRRMLGVLREVDRVAELEPQPSVDDLSSLLEHAQAAGVETNLSITGQRRPLPPGIELTVYRVVQEALTNVIRHAGRPAVAAIEVDFGGDAVQVSVIDNGLGIGASAATAGTGHGLLGMRERVEIYDGGFRAAPRPGGGYEVSASMPIPARASL